MAKVEVDEVLGLCMIISMVTAESAHHPSKESLTVCDEAAEVPANNAMPCCTLPLVELSPVSVNHKRVAVLRRTVRLMW